MNLPRELNFGSNRKINYFYNFDGEKQRQTVENNGTLTKTDYCGPFVYETASGVRSLKFIITPEGRAVKTGTTWDYEYNLKDHLGNVRTVIHKGSNGLAEVIQEKHYYPSGLEMSSLSLGNSTNKYLYNGKEYQKDLGLGWYDYGARFYDPAIGRWHTPDIKAEKYYNVSQYAYCMNNPVKFIDPDGKDVVLLLAKDGAGGYGHMGAVVQDGNGKFYYMTVGNADAAAGTSKLVSSGAQGGMVLQPLDAKDMNEAVSLAKQDQNNSEYTDQLRLNTSSSMDKAIFGSAQELQESINSGETKYNALTNNCADAVVKVVEKGTGVDLPTGTSPKPNAKFASIKEGVKNVQYNLSIKTKTARVVTVSSTMDNVPTKTDLIKKLDEQPK